MLGLLKREWFREPRKTTDVHASTGSARTEEFDFTETVRTERGKPRFAWHGVAKKRLLMALFDDFSPIYKSLF